MRTYSGHSTAQASNQLYRTNLAKGQTGLSVAFDLPTQTGYDPDAPEAEGEVGKVGVPVAHLGHMAELMDGIPLGPDEHVDDHQRHRGLAARPLRRPGRRHRRRAAPARRHHPERHRQGVPLPGHLHLPARAQPAPDRGHGGLDGAPRPQVEPDQRVQLPPPGSRRHPGAGAGLRPGDRHRRGRRGARLGPVDARRSCRPSSGGCRFSAMPAFASWRRPARCGPSPPLWDRIAGSAGASRTPSCAASATASRSTRSASPSSSRKTTCPASSSRPSA